MREKYARALRPDHQMFDEVVIRTVPRYKDSHLSGEEWRISATIEYKCKGKTMREASYRDIATALDFSKAEYWRGCDNGREDIPYEQEFCDQEGCKNKWSHLFKMKEVPKDLYPHRAFCERHKRRGDQDLHDRDENYELIHEINK